MPKFVIEETVPTWVTYRRTVEADTLEEAIESFKAGGDEETLWGEAVENVPYTLEVDGVLTERNGERVS